MSFCHNGKFGIKRFFSITSFETPCSKSLISLPNYLWGGSQGQQPGAQGQQPGAAGTASLGRLKLSHGQQQFLIVLMASHQSGTKQDQTVAPLARITVGAASRIFLANISWDILDTWSNQRIWDISIRRSGSTFRASRISQLHALSRSVTSWPLRKNLISVACTWDNVLLFITQDSWPPVRIGKKTELKTDSNVVLENFHFVTTEP